MKNCKKCGYPLNEKITACPKCGEKILEDNFFDITERDIKENKNIAILCYFGILMLIPFLTRQDSKFIKYHSNQGLLLIILSIISSFITVIPFIGWLLGMIGMIFSFVFFIMGIINVVKGKVKPLPLIGKYKIINIYK